MIQQAGLLDKINASAKERPRTREGRGATASLLQRGMAEQLRGYAITAKPSANLYILLQVSPDSESHACLLHAKYNYPKP